LQTAIHLLHLLLTQTHCVQYTAQLLSAVTEETEGQKKTSNNIQGGPKNSDVDKTTRLRTNTKTAVDKTGFPD